jgi:hypothetical protein
VNNNIKIIIMILRRE